MRVRRGDPRLLHQRLRWGLDPEDAAADERLCASVGFRQNSGLHTRISHAMVSCVFNLGLPFTNGPGIEE